jgi:hypothetical protein
MLMWSAKIDFQTTMGDREAVRDFIVLGGIW